MVRGFAEIIAFGPFLFITDFFEWIMKEKLAADAWAREMKEDYVGGPRPKRVNVKRGSEWEFTLNNTPPGLPTSQGQTSQ